MMLRALSADFLKIRRKGIWFLIFLAPLGLVAMQALNFGLRFDYLMKRYADDPWGGLLKNISGFVPIALFLGCTLVSSLVANVEHQLSSWKQLLALPISRTAVFGAKFLLCLLLLSVSCILLPIATIILGLVFGFALNGIPLADLARIGFFPLFAALPLLALQLWLSLTYRNPSLPVSLGVVLSLVSPFTLDLSEWFPLNWPVFGYLGPHREWFVALGIAVGAVILLAGLVHFNRKDVD
ncbi:MAG: ABC transporter permease [Paenibacillus macerans]|uniref:Permease n=2 Tax=Paenibacillus macerans TaxID=44252 RepID=A0A6N8EPF0_PAEMA|nr:ABC transporter permease [Paenibacillus macerans]MBS5913554.1 ABC transporter permease [Paenibacillus macerans]MCY7559579.1 ABC transporter permease [Paenibacillus macerans]MDU5947085.1 ABC transporter permease [Paenibacillus macerans]MDU7474107.1 ABC transporter permease [Paenibacillus macerans]MEC0136606.1 ABC transporter permease [Paenibacillus macerans]